MTNFDEIIDRSGTYSVKYDLLEKIFGREDLTSLWVADMDFKSPECIINALKKYTDAGVYGYNIEPYELKESIKDWLEEVQGWKVEREWLSYIPGIIRGISFALHHFTHKGDSILVQTPVYHPFMRVPEKNERKLIFNPLCASAISSHFSMDFENLERVTEDENCKMMILCNPHNPGGITWKKEELQRVAEICHRKGIIVISDEIHSDLMLWGKKHIPFASVSKEAAEISITFGAPSKTFNIAGLSSSYAVIPNPKIREDFYHWMEINEYNHPMINASLATIAAYREGNPWRKELITYLESNVLAVEKFFAQKLPEIKVFHPEASYLLWLDCREYLRKIAAKKGLPENQETLTNHIINKAHLALNDGTIFNGDLHEGDGFMRLNIGLPQKKLIEALNRLILK